MTRIVGSPRNRSMYMTAIARSGKKTEPGRLRRIARNNAKARITASHIRKYWMLRTNFDATSGKESRNSWPLKKACFTAGQLGDRATAQAISPNTTIVLTTAMATPFAPSCRKTSPRMRDRPRASGPGGAGAPGGPARLKVPFLGLEDRHLADVRLLRQPLGRDVLQRVVCFHGLEGLVHARNQGAPLLERHAEVLRRGGRRELSHDDAVLDLLHVRVCDVQRRRVVGDDAVHGVGVE